ncbi:LacI family DNA-binding transcriptional regulator [Leifsonia poae]|uniref:LacI family transcriptional regulator n=1 Tax=Leifsonia poae TaxID=110933 RepID=A0A9W6M0E9_9MICO|nr:LacI family DNA-binding transcriptional regulator [Leifsonia poae]GLJ76652.1 LacI family transcriptional regulator [Leifsonia poae]
MRDVARLAGVSHQTVSRVINGHPSIRDTTRDRVLSAMDELRYRPNRAARALVTARSNTIGVLAASAAALYGPVSSMGAIQDAGREAGYYVTVAHLGDLSADGIAAGLEHLIAQAVEGIIVIAPADRVLDEIVAIGVDVPYVTLQAGTAYAENELSVDQVAGARAATRHLIDLGHTNIVHLSGPTEWIEAFARLRGYEQEMIAAGLPVPEAPRGDWTAARGYEAGLALLADPAVTAVFASNDQMALGLYHAAHELGRDIPGDVSVVGFDDIPEAAHFWPPLTTVRQDFTELARRCVARLLAEIDGRTEPTPGNIQPELIVRASTRALHA